MSLVLAISASCSAYAQNYENFNSEVENTVTLILIIAGIVFIFWFFSILLWISAMFSGVKISPLQLGWMRIRQVPPSKVVRSLIEAHQAGLVSINRKDLEAHHMSGGDITNLIHALVSAEKANIPLSFQQAAAIDLAGRNVLDAVNTSVNPKVIDTPAVEAVAKDGIQVIVKERITVRSNINKLVGGAGEETIIARVGESIVTSIGSSESHKDVMENPDNISRLVLDKGLDKGTAFEILSVDIADVDLGKNVGATLQIERANAEKNVAQAKAEERRAMAIALEQEMKANKIKAEAAVPLALAKALESGNMGFVDFYRLKNLQSDTAMREQIANGKSDPAVVMDIQKRDDPFFE